VAEAIESAIERQPNDVGTAEAADSALPAAGRYGVGVHAAPWPAAAPPENGPDRAGPP